MSDISQQEIQILKNIFTPLIGIKIDWLTIPQQALPGFEPSQIAVIVNTLLDGILPQIELISSDIENQEKLKNIGLQKSPSIIGERESYPDYIHLSGKRVELKGLFVDNLSLKLKRPPTPREPSARLKENITINNINTEKDVLLIVAIQIQEENRFCSPYIVDIEVLSMVECIKARDKRLQETGGKWIDGIPEVVSTAGKKKLKIGQNLTDADYEKDTNFGKLKRIPYQPLQDFLSKWT
ncbi:hypothetical protein H6F32_09150 [Anabaena sp. FACHB-1237]|uniref:hypothetical protein n=1 Tax=Anabaena sp. FACHB-1237 TaxID=2692769 RepID=UPI001680EACF|nr:hypothetical protein [Anabaena sp. FACHB-1237]MBD2137751.1 hypothetical protein [Anabaena sp. FACHB-1237]